MNGKKCWSDLLKIGKKSFLENEFEKQQYMVGTGRLYLASTLNLTEAQVKVWFQVIQLINEFFFHWSEILIDDHYLCIIKIESSN